MFDIDSILLTKAKTELAFRAMYPFAPNPIPSLQKLHEQMIGAEDAFYTYEYPEHYKILPQINDWGSDQKRIKDGIKVPDGFTYASDTNPEWMTDDELQSWMNANSDQIGKI